MKHLTVDELLTVQELAQALKVKVSWVYSRTRQTGPGAIPVIHVGKYCRFRFSDVMDWINRQGRDSVA